MSIKSELAKRNITIPYSASTRQHTCHSSSRITHVVFVLTFVMSLTGLMQDMILKAKGTLVDTCCSST